MFTVNFRNAYAECRTKCAKQNRENTAKSKLFHRFLFFFSYHWFDFAFLSGGHLFSHKIDSNFAIIQIEFAMEILMVNIWYYVTIIVQCPYSYIIDSSNISRFHSITNICENQSRKENKLNGIYWNFSVLWFQSEIALQLCTFNVEVFHAKQ